MRKIELFETELKLYQSVKSFDVKNKFAENQCILEASKDLTEKLIERNAIPENRIKYFIDRRYQTGRSKMSRKEVFESNGTRGKEILKDPNFLKYLDFFINGANISKAIQKKAIRIFEENTYHDEAINKLYDFIKRNNYTPQDNFGREQFAEEIFKLAIDLNYELHYCFDIRRKLMGIR